MNLNAIESKILDLEKETSRLKGRLDETEDKFMETEKNISDLKKLSLINKKAIEVLNTIQKTTNELITAIFENITTNALQYVYNDERYKFKLELSRHGNKPKLKFLLFTPDKQLPHDICFTSGGGEKDIVVLALRFVLLECSKNKGFLFLDEPFKRLDSEETWERGLNFIKETQRDTKRQICIIGHEKEKQLVEFTDNPIIFKKEN